MIVSFVFAGLGLLDVLFILINYKLWEKARKNDDHKKAKKIKEVIKFSLLFLFMLVLIQYRI